MKNITTIADFLFEVGTLRKLVRMHRQVLLTDDLSDSIASHSYRVALIGWCIAKMEGLDTAKVVMMCILHDVAEARSGDHNWIHKRYVTVHENEINREQLSTLPFPDFSLLIAEYEKRKSPESLAAKDADEIDQILLLKEYAWQGNREAKLWLEGKNRRRTYARVERLKTRSGKKLGRAIYDRSPSEWWKHLWTPLRRAR